MTEDVERQPLLGPDSAAPVELNGVNGSSNTTTTVSPIGPDELPPPYNTLAGGVPMVSCRVCSSMIDISGKKDQVGQNLSKHKNNSVIAACCEMQLLQ